MADSNITRKALADALKSLMKEKPFHKINIRYICEKCGMNRKSFYYHFKDKYDLLNWIFYTEMIQRVESENYSMSFELLHVICDYLCENRDFYRKALQIEGQNSFIDYFREFLQGLMMVELKKIYPDIEATAFRLNFFTDAILCSITRWLTSSSYMPSHHFCKELESCISILARHYQKIEEK